MNTLNYIFLVLICLLEISLFNILVLIDSFRVSVKSKPLDIIYNPTAIHRLKEFFKPESSDSYIPTAAQVRYQELKKHTKADIKEVLEKFLEGDEEV